MKIKILILTNAGSDRGVRGESDRQARLRGPCARPGEGGRFGVEPKLGKAELAEMRTKFSRPGSNKSELAKRYGIARSTLYGLA